MGNRSGSDRMGKEARSLRPYAGVAIMVLAAGPFLFWSPIPTTSAWPIL